MTVPPQFLKFLADQDTDFLVEGRHDLVKQMPTSTDPVNDEFILAAVETELEERGINFRSVQ